MSGLVQACEGLERVVQAIGTVRAPVTLSEYELHALVERALREGGFSPRHEAPIAPRCRIDFIAGRVGVEIKRGKPDLRRLAAQCARYLSSDALDALVVVVDTRAALPGSIGGKPLRVVGLNRLWGIALP